MSFNRLSIPAKSLQAAEALPINPRGTRRAFKVSKIMGQDGNEYDVLTVPVLGLDLYPNRVTPDIGPEDTFNIIVLPEKCYPGGQYPNFQESCTDWATLAPVIRGNGGKWYKYFGAAERHWENEQAVRDHYNIGCVIGRVALLPPLSHSWGPLASRG